MPHFEVRVDGEVVFETEDNVLSAEISTKQGQATRVGVEQHSFVDVKLTRAESRNPRLPDVERGRREEQRRNAEEGGAVSVDSDSPEPVEEEEEEENSTQQDETPTPFDTGNSDENE